VGLKPVTMLKFRQHFDIPITKFWKDLGLNEHFFKKNFFAIETTLSGKNYLDLIAKVKQQGYLVNLVFLYLDIPELAKERVENRVRAGGHSIPESDIMRRFYRGITNLIDFYLPIVDTASVYDASTTQREKVAQKLGDQITILNNNIWQKILEKKQQNL
jgi:predicted ABC-type ATPase